MRHIFISHVEEDADVALGIVLGLEQKGFRTWCYEVDSIPGVSYLVQTGQAIQSSSAVVLIVSADSLGSKQVTSEVVRAHESGKPFIPVLRGIAHVEFQARQPEWREAIGAAASIRIPAEGPKSVVPRIGDGLEALGIRPKGGGDAARLWQIRRKLYELRFSEEARPEAIEALEQARTGRLGVISWLRRVARLGRSEHPPAPGGRRHEKRRKRPPPVMARAPAPETLSKSPRASDHLCFTVTAPHVVQPRDRFIINVWAHLARQRELVMRQAREAAVGEIFAQPKGPFEVARGTLLSVQVRVEGIMVEELEDTVLWSGEIANATFAATVPDRARTGRRVGVATVRAGGLRIAQIPFVITVGRRVSDLAPVSHEGEPHRKAFASYARHDLDEVLGRVQGMQKVAPQLEVFLDVLSLRSGEDWAKRLWNEIPSNDIFYLFWSLHAKQSEWVQKEWRCALETKGLDFIDPVPLVSPEKVPPPPELASKHFSDWVLAFKRGERQAQGDEGTESS
jgi:hypothetical protein